MKIRRSVMEELYAARVNDGFGKNEKIIWEG